MYLHLICQSSHHDSSPLTWLDIEASKSSTKETLLDNPKQHALFILPGSKGSLTTAPLTLAMLTGFQ